MVLIIGMIAMLIIPNIPFVKRIGEDSQMKTKAGQINQAIGDWRSDRPLRQALQDWKNKDADTRYTMIAPYIQYAAPTLSQFMVEGYVVTFPDDPRNPVTLTDPDGKTVSYQ